MRKVLLALAASLVVPAALAAQGPPTKNAPTREEPGVITLAQARNAALAQVRQTLAQGKDPCCVPIRSDRMEVVNASLITVNGKQAYVVAVGSPGVPTSVRVTLEPKTGAVLDVKQGAWSWGMAPVWFKQGLNSPPPARTNSPPPAKSN